MNKIKETIKNLTKNDILNIIFIFTYQFILLSMFCSGIAEGIILSLLGLLMYYFNDTKKHFITSIFVFLIPSLTLFKINGVNTVSTIIISVIIVYIAFMSHGVKRDNNALISNILVLLMPFITISIIEVGQGNLINFLDMTFNWNADIALARHLANYIIAFIIFSIFFLLSIIIKKKKVAFLIVNIPLLILGIANMCVWGMTSKPLLPTDILIFGTAMNAIENQTIKPGLVVLVIVVIILCIVYLVGFFKLFGKSEFSKKTKYIGILMMLVSILIYSVFSNVRTSKFRYNTQFGFLFGFLMDTQDKFEAPAGYEEYKLEDFSVLAENENENDNIKPNVIFVMSEAFSDLTTTFNIEVNQDPIPYFRSLMEQYPSGKVYSSVLGNNTVSSEYESLTGISTAFTKRGADIYNRYMPEYMYSLGEYYQNLGYKSGILHICPAINYNRLNVYKQLNYDIQTFSEQIPKVELLRTFASDRQNFEYVEKAIKDTDEPLFLFNITIQNHGLYDDGVNLDDKVKVTEKGKQYDSLDTYLTLLKETDKVTETFLNNIKEIKEPTVVIFYGDHQPLLLNEVYSSLYEENVETITVDKLIKNYEVPYLIWSNYDVKTDYEVPEITSMNYLSLIINRYLGQPTTEWFNIIEETQQSYPVITENFAIDNENNVYDTESLKSILAKNENLSKKDKALRKYQFACYSFFDKNKK